MRSQQRQVDELRLVRFSTGLSHYAEGSVLIEFGDTRVLCSATVEQKVPDFLRGANKGWVTAEYSMLPRATHTRTKRDVTQGQISGRSSEIQRLIGRSLRAAINLSDIPGITIRLDCDVLQADGGTRTASITGAYVALVQALYWMVQRQMLVAMPRLVPVAAVSVGLKDGIALLDLDYAEDSCCDTDLNLVMTGQGQVVEIQGTAEGQPFSQEQLLEMVQLGSMGCAELNYLQLAYLQTLMPESKS